MKSLPFPVRVAAGLAVTAVEQARHLPARIAGLPVTVASQALQVSMRVQQQVTELAIRGDEVLSSLRPVEETPEWATFDEDLDDGFDRGFDAPRPSAFDQVTDDDLDEHADDRADEHADEHADDRANGFRAPDPWVAEERALADEPALAEEPTLAEEPPARQHDLVTAENYDQLSLAQLRARLRRFSAEELAELLDHERTHANRPSFVGMLTRRIATVRDQQ